MPMSASIGISLYPDHATDIDTLMQQADAAMYMAKQAGRSTHRIFSAEMNVLAEQRLALIAALRRAIAEGALSLSYQPQIRSPQLRRRDPRRRSAGALARCRAR
jgi:predicted signal transduction protein with EAL and GGDEF domain